MNTDDAAVIDKSNIKTLVVGHSYPESFRLDENKGKAWRTDKFYPDFFDIDGLIYELSDCRQYKTNSWAIYEKKQLRIKI